MFNHMINNFDIEMIQNQLLRNFDNSSSSSFSYWSDDDYEQEEYHPYYTLDGIKTRIVWVTNYITGEEFPIHVSADDPVAHIDNSIKQETLLSNEIDDLSFLNKLHTVDLSKLNLDDLLLLLYRLQQKTTKNSITTSTSPISSSSSSSSSFQSPIHSHAVPSMMSHIPPTSRRQSSFTLSNLADVPKKLTTTLSKPICSYHSQNSKHIHSPNDVVDKLVQSFNLQHSSQTSIQHRSPSYTYQESQQHKAKLISNLLRKSSHPNKFYH